MLLNPGLYVTDNLFLTDGALLISMAVGLAAAVAVVCWFSRTRGGRRHASSVLLGLLVGFFTLTFVLLVPVLWVTQGGNPLLAFLQTTFLTIQSPTLNSGAADVLGGGPSSFVGTVYCVLLNICYVAMPLLAIFNIPDLVGHRFSQLRYWAICQWSVRGRDVYVFSGLGEREMSLAREVLGRTGGMRRSGRPVVIFANVSHAERDAYNDDLASIDSADLHCLEQGFSDLALRLCDPVRFARCGFFALSDDAARNVAKTCAALAKLRGTTTDEGIELPRTKAFLESNNELGSGRSSAELPVNRVKFFVRIDSSDDQLVIDAANTSTGGSEGVCSLHIRTLKEESLAAFALLQRAPLYSALSNEDAVCTSLRPTELQTLDVLVLGSGSFAESMVLNVLWAGQMHNVRLRVTVADDDALAMESRMRMRYRGLFDVDEHFGAGYAEKNLFSLEFKGCALRSPALYHEVLGPLSSCEHLYVIVAREDGDAVNHEIALNARLFYLDQHVGVSEPPVVPIIAALVKDESMASLVSDRLDLGTKSYGIVTFGSGLFGYDAVLGSELERSAQLADDIYGYLYEVGGQFNGREVDPNAVREAVVGMMENPPEGGIPSNDISSAPQIMYHSNLAQALHADYKSWAMGLDTAEGRRRNAGLEVSSDVIRRLAAVEHNRWWVMYLTFGYTYLTFDQQRRFSAGLRDGFKDKNRVRKLDEVRKHTLLCPWERIWENYAHAVGGFSYPLAADLGPGGTRLSVRALDGNGNLVTGFDLQLVTQWSHRVVEEWTVGPLPHVTQPLPRGAYLLHPSSAPDGLQAGNDSTVITADGREGELRVDYVLTGAGPLVNPVVYDMAFCCSIWWQDVRGQRA